MQEHKFKYYDILHQRFGVVKSIDFETETLVYRIDGNLCKGKINEYLVKFIGLQDITGEEIYSGHIVEHPAYDKPYSVKRKMKMVKGVVEWHSGKSVSGKGHKNPSSFNTEPSFEVRDIANSNYNCGDWSSFHNCKIVGNIFQNPELIELGRVASTAK